MSLLPIQKRKKTFFSLLLFLLEEEKEHAMGDVGELVIEGLELADDCILLGGAVTALVEPGNRREDSGYLRSDFLYAAVLEGTLHELVGLFRAKLLFLDDGINLLLLALTNEGVPVIVPIRPRCHEGRWRCPRWS